jgi:TatD DNase family protein
MKLIDTHCHINLKEFNEDFGDVIERIETRLECVINVGFDLKSSEESVKLSNRYESIYATVGIHPHDASTYDGVVEAKLRELAKNPKVLAIGEIGLDYYRNLSPKEIQKEVFKKQIELALEIGKPVVIHCRDAYEDTINILKEYKEIKGIMHSYSGSYETAKILMDRFYFSISGPVTFKNAVTLREMVEKLPIEKILVETDSPYLTPEPFRGKRNEPCYVEYVAKMVAEIKGISYDEIIKITNENTKIAFGMGVGE